MQLGQTSRTPGGTKDGIKINLPNKVITLATPHSGANMWYSGADQDWADVKLTRQVDVPAAADAKFWMWNNYVIEEDWDFGFVEVSTDGGATWTEQKVYDEAGKLVTTDDGYADPNGRMADYGGKKYGLTGEQRRLAARLRRPVGVRRQDGPAAAAPRHRRRVPGAGLVRRRLLGHRRRRHHLERRRRERRNGWTQTGGTFTDTTGAGWHIDTGTQRAGALLPGRVAQLRRLRRGPEVRLRHDVLARGVEGREDPYNAPGMLVWYRDTTLGNINHVTAQT